MLLGVIPGALGLILRKIFWPRLFGSCGRGVQFAQNIVIRHPKRIHLGSNVVISEYCVLDARTVTSNQVLTLGDDVILSNNVMVSCKDGEVSIGARTGIGAQTIIQSTNQCPVSIGEDVMIGPRCYLVGGGNYNIDRLDIPMNQQGIKQDTGAHLASDVWLGANVSILGGVHVAAGSIAAAGSVVTRSVPARSIVAGVPAKVIKKRDKS
jgi:galactoside O-acetyltransferase